ncbi:homeobox protein 2-like [Leptopilina boulardi]|uniref:homeobox protein 2-like n=1 Tax=Leptopilina boulardi TaxID=63433 RepID=UPI0021F55C76|nr:homeobox protein 2-like [Leptopilina boulardi]
MWLALRASYLVAVVLCNIQDSLEDENTKRSFLTRRAIDGSRGRKYYDAKDDGFFEDYGFDRGHYNARDRSGSSDIRSSVPGEPGVDYPAYERLPQTSFTCEGRDRGYYADDEAGCQLFHVCDNILVSSFLCPVGSLFSQKLQTCDWWNKVDCSTTRKFYTINRNYYDQSDGDEMIRKAYVMIHLQPDEGLITEPEERAQQGKITHYPRVDAPENDLPTNYDDSENPSSSFHDYSKQFKSNQEIDHDDSYNDHILYSHEYQNPKIYPNSLLRIHKNNDETEFRNRHSQKGNSYRFNEFVSDEYQPSYAPTVPTVTTTSRRFYSPTVPMSYRSSTLAYDKFDQNLDSSIHLYEHGRNSLSTTTPATPFRFKNSTRGFLKYSSSNEKEENIHEKDQFYDDNDDNDDEKFEIMEGRESIGLVRSSSERLEEETVTQSLIGDNSFENSTKNLHEFANSKQTNKSHSNFSEEDREFDYESRTEDKYDDYESNDDELINSNINSTVSNNSANDDSVQGNDDELSLKEGDDLLEKVEDSKEIENHSKEQDNLKNHRDYSKEHRDYFKDHQDYPKDHQDYSKDHQNYSKEHRDYSKDYQDYQKDHQDYSKDHQDYSKDHQDYSKNHQDYPKDQKNHQDYSKEEQNYPKNDQHNSKEISTTSDPIFNLAPQLFNSEEKIIPELSSVLQPPLVPYQSFRSLDSDQIPPPMAINRPPLPYQHYSNNQSNLTENLQSKNASNIFFENHDNVEKNNSENFQNKNNINSPTDGNFSNNDRENNSSSNNDSFINSEEQILRKYNENLDFTIRSSIWNHRDSLAKEKFENPLLNHRTIALDLEPPNEDLLLNFDSQTSSPTTIQDSTKYESISENQPIENNFEASSILQPDFVSPEIIKNNAPYQVTLPIKDESNTEIVYNLNEKNKFDENFQIENSKESEISDESSKDTSLISHRDDYQLKLIQKEEENLEIHNRTGKSAEIENDQRQMRILQLMSELAKTNRLPRPFSTQIEKNNNQTKLSSINESSFLRKEQILEQLTKSFGEPIYGNQRDENESLFQLPYVNRFTEFRTGKSIIPEEDSTLGTKNEEGNEEEEEKEERKREKLEKDEKDEVEEVENQEEEEEETEEVENGEEKEEVENEEEGVKEEKVDTKKEENSEKIKKTVVEMEFLPSLGFSFDTHEGREEYAQAILHGLVTEGAIVKSNDKFSSRKLTFDSTESTKNI